MRSSSNHRGLGGVGGVGVNWGAGSGSGAGAGAGPPGLHPALVMQRFTQFQNRKPLFPDGKDEREHCAMHLSLTALQSGVSQPDVGLDEGVAGVPNMSSADTPESPFGSTRLNGLPLTYPYVDMLPPASPIGSLSGYLPSAGL